MSQQEGRMPWAVRLGRRRGLAVLGTIALLTVGGVSTVGCGSSSGTSSAAGQGGGTTSIQVLATVKRGDIVQSVFGAARLATSKGKTVALVQVDRQNAASVAVGQKATVLVFRGGQGFPRPGQSGFPQPGQSGFPQPGQSGLPGGQNGSGALGSGGFDGNGARGRGAAGTVTKVTTNADGSATVMIALDKRPANASATSAGFASIETKVLASNVLVIPTAAIKGSGTSATVQVLSGGKTSTVSVVVGQQSGGQSEIKSGLSEGQNVVFTRSFRRGGFPGSGSGPVPGQSGMPFPPGGQSGGQSSGGSL
jgi:macrolide-specific efflux system membrane fusion protein